MEIPTFKKSKKVMFYDILQKLAIRVVRLYHVRTILKENSKKITVLEKLLRGGNAYKLLF